MIKAIKEFFKGFMYEEVTELPVSEPLLEKIPEPVKPKPFDLFLEKTQSEMKAAGVRLTLADATHVSMKGWAMQCNGFFTDAEDNGLEFAVGMKKDFDKWAPVYIHEYGHFTQWRDRAPEWEAVIIDGLNSDDFLDKWTDTDEQFKKSSVDTYIDASIACEADCERRAVELILEHDLPFDEERYAQTANAYVHFYNYIRLKRKWYKPGQEPYNIEEVVSQMNTTVDTDFSVSYEYIDLFEKYCS